MLAVFSPCCHCCSRSQTFPTGFQPPRVQLALALPATYRWVGCVGLRARALVPHGSRATSPVRPASARPCSLPPRYDNALQIPKDPNPDPDPNPDANLGLSVLTLVFAATFTCKPDPTPAPPEESSYPKKKGVGGPWFQGQG